MVNLINKLNSDGFVVVDLGGYFPNARYLVETKAFVFNGGEPHVVINEHSFKTKVGEYLRDYTPTTPIKVLVTCRAVNTNNFFSMLAAVNALRNIGIKHISLFIPYFPGARQDRINHFGEPFTAKIYAKIINSLSLENVYVVDPHSLVTPALVKNFIQVSHDSQVVDFAINCLNYSSLGYDGCREIYLIAPDEGALKKTQHYGALITERTGKKVHTVFAAKTRDTSTGEIIDYKLYGDITNNFSIFVFDDICDGGKTFNDLGKLIDEQNKTSERYLFNTHGIFAKGFSELFKHYSIIGCTESFTKFDDNFKSQYGTILQYNF